MRRIVAHMQTTLDGRISNADGLFWEPFPFGDPEMAFVNSAFKDCDTWAMSRRMYEFIVPYWEQVAAGTAGPVSPAQADFAAILSDLTKVVFSRTIGPDDTRRRQVIGGDIAGRLQDLKAGPGKDIALSCGPATLGELSRTSGLIDEYLLVLHPAVITAGPRLFDNLAHDLALSLVHAEVFDAGAIIARYRVEDAR